MRSVRCQECKGKKGLQEVKRHVQQDLVPQELPLILQGFNYVLRSQVGAEQRTSSFARCGSLVPLIRVLSMMQWRQSQLEWMEERKDGEAMEEEGTDNTGSIHSQAGRENHSHSRECMCGILPNPPNSLSGQICKS